MRFRRILLLLLAALLLAAAALLALLETELWGWSATARREDARLTARSFEAPAWEVSRTVQARTARSLLGVEDDIRFRKAVELFRLSRPLDEGASKGSDQLLESAEAESDLAAVELRDTDAQRRARAATMLGVLDFEDSLYDKENELLHIGKSLAEFRSAIRIDPRAAEGRFDLELLLRLLGPKSGSGGAAAAGGGVGTGANGAGFSRPGGGY